jgi:uncharacterized iron-regulated membrane protein
MRLLSALHRWAGGVLGLLLALLAFSGTLLVWEGEWIALPGAAQPLAEDVATIGAIADRAAAAGTLARITFASDEIGLHQLSFTDGGGAYVAQDGRLVDGWTSPWQRPELWLFDLHHHLFAGAAGETVTGIAGIAGLLFVLTGLVLWWRSRRSFAPRLWPRRMAPGPIVSQHRDLGLLAAPLLLLSLVTGTLMIFDPLRDLMVGTEVRPRAALAAPVDGASPSAMLATAKAHFPDAGLRRLSIPADSGDPILVRMRQSAEWTPNGRTQLAFDQRSGQLLWVEDARRANAAAWMAEKLYPLHAAKVGGLAMKLAMTTSGLALFLLGGLATFSFWTRRAGKRRKRRPRGGGPKATTGSGSVPARAPSAKHPAV